MPQIEIKLLGSFRVALQGQPITTFHSDKVRALLAYLIVESSRSHRRETLCGLLWPDYPERSARQSLSQALYVLRQALGDEAEPSDEFSLQVSYQDVSLRVSAQVADVARFAELMEQARRTQRVDLLRQALALYAGDLLEGFTLADSPEFEEWLQIERETLRRQAVEAAGALAVQAVQNADCAAGLASARRWLALAPLDEAAHRCLMRLLFADGQRSEALAQYARCAEALHDELGIAPEAATTALYERIRAGQMEGEPAARQTMSVTPPASLRGKDRFHRPLFVSREDELGRLESHLAKAISGEPQVVFVTGEAGSGKTALLHEFALRATSEHEDLVAAVGYCTAFSGHGDPHLAFRELFAQLTGDIEARWAAGMLAREQALRLWRVAPITCQAVAEQGADLVSTLLPANALVGRATRFAANAPWLGELQRLAQVHGAESPEQGHPQPALFSQCTAVLARVARQIPLLLVVEDLHWADEGTIDLLFHLGSRLQGVPILIVGTYRRAELLDGRDASDRHPLVRAVNEFRRRFGDVEVNLDDTDPLAFVEALVNAEPNTFDLGFRQSLAKRSGGIPLFVAELVRNMKERGELFRDEGGRWQIATHLEWDAIPTRIEGVLAERIGRLEPELLRTMTAASVLGETFHADTLANMLRVEAREAVRMLSRDLHRKHYLVSPLEGAPADVSGLGRYRFRHVLVRDYVYGEIDPAERRLLHREAAEAIEAQYGTQLDEVAGRLAWHYEQAGMLAESVDCLRRAGGYAMSLTALQDAVGLFHHGLELLETLPAGIDRDRRELALQIGLGDALHSSRGMSSSDAGETYHRIYVLSQALGDPSGMSESLQLLNAYYGSRGQLDVALDYALELLAFARRNQDEELAAVARRTSGWVRLTQGDLPGALADLPLPTAWHDEGPPLGAPSAAEYITPGLCNRGDTLFVMGCLEQGARCMVGALRNARAIGQPGELCRVYAYDARQRMYLGDAVGCMKAVRQGMPLARDYGLPTFEMTLALCQGWARVRLGSLDEGLRLIQKALAAAQDQEAGVFLAWIYAVQAEVLGLAGHPDEGLLAVERGLQAADETGAGLWVGELQRIAGDLQLMREGPDALRAESAYLAAIETTRTQGARLFELRACVSLGRLWHNLGRSKQARELVCRAYASFTEGYDTPDLVAARALLRELNAVAHQPGETLGKGS